MPAGAKAAYQPSKAKSFKPPAEARVGTPGSSAEGFSLVTPRALTRLLSMKAATEFTLIMAKSICPPATSAEAPLQPL